MRRTSGRSVGTLLRFDTHFIPEIYTCYPSLSQYFLFHQLFYQFLRLSTSSLLHFYSKVQNVYLLSLNFLNTSSFTNSSTSSYASLPPRFYTFTPKCKICTCSPSTFSILPLSPTLLPVLTPLYLLASTPLLQSAKYVLALPHFLNTSSFTNSSTSSYASLPPRFYTFTPKCKMCSYNFSLELKLSCDISKERSIWSVKLCQVLTFCRYAILCTLTC